MKMAGCVKRGKKFEFFLDHTAMFSFEYVYIYF